MTFRIHNFRLYVADNTIILVLQLYAQFFSPPHLWMVSSLFITVNGDSRHASDKYEYQIRNFRFPRMIVGSIAQRVAGLALGTRGF